MPRRGEALRELRVDELVDHDPGRRSSSARTSSGARPRRRRSRSDTPTPGSRASARAAARPRRYSPSPTSRSRLPSSRDLLREPDLGARAGDLAQHGVADGLAAGGLLERGGVEVGDVVEAVLLRARARRGGGSQRARRRARPPRPRRPESCSATSSGSSANQPRSRDDERLAERERAHRACPDVSPIVGARSETQTSQPAISAQSRSSGTYSSRRTRRIAEQARLLEPPVEVEARRDGPDEHEPRARRAGA